MRFYSGIARNEKELEVPAGWLEAGREVYLDLGRLWAVARVTLNGRELGVLWKPPYRVNVTDALNGGANRLVIEVVNTWSNRLVGDARTEGEDFARTNIEHSDGTPWDEVDLIPSGLFGPVRLIPAVEVDVQYNRD